MENVSRRYNFQLMDNDGAGKRNTDNLYEEEGNLLYH